ncbi:NADPH-dependent FMN reductase [Pseudoxanthomonas kalamensis DSM 18571]|uniref:NADPH-dependent FMN reductase n=1 Tax=Pseudoxanthomonas kalamensis TaxID=289483 RepID=UPI0013910F93|nr:NAD(P)H-dependent oxidoreductase [Pseudoxanthomonas kalamensis]KAF1710642.1 NADPH-dependent FMN reductase [Pseudoxanthomonas kalamensis DSM 18571]
MALPRIGIIVGSLRRASLNRQLAQAVAGLGEGRFDFDFIEIGELPPYNQDDDDNFPAAALRFKQQVEAADALLFVTPEYNRSVPGVLKNAIDIGTRPAGSNSFAGKHAAVIGTSPGAHGTVSAQQHLRNVLAAVGVAVLPQPEIAIQYREGQIEGDQVPDERLRKFLLLFLDRFEAWLR